MDSPLQSRWRRLAFKSKCSKQRPSQVAPQRTLPLTFPGFLPRLHSTIQPNGRWFPLLLFSSSAEVWTGVDPFNVAAGSSAQSGAAALLERSLKLYEANLGEDGKAWRHCLHHSQITGSDCAGSAAPSRHIPASPLFMARFTLGRFHLPPGSRLLFPRNARESALRRTCRAFFS